MPYKKVVHTFDVYTRPLWNFFLDQASDPILARQAQWHAVKESRWNGSRWIRIYGEPVTGQRAWDTEVCISSCMSFIPL